MTVDGTDFQINEPSQFDPMWYSHKYNGPAIRYELGVSIHTGWIVWTHGPFPAGDFTDLEIFRLGLKAELAPYEKVEADLGYCGDAKVRTPTDYDNNQQWRWQKGKARARHETINGVLKEFKILSTPYRSSLTYHYLILNAIVGIVQSEILEGRATYQLAEYDVRTIPEEDDNITEGEEANE